MRFLFTANKKLGTLILSECAHINASFFVVRLYSGNCYCIEDGMKAEQLFECLS